MNEDVVLTHTHTLTGLLAIKKNEIMPFSARWVDLEMIILSEVGQRQTTIICHHLYVNSNKMIQRTCLQNRTRLTDIENKHMVAKRGPEGINY